MRAGPRTATAVLLVAAGVAMVGAGTAGADIQLISRSPAGANGDGASTYASITTDGGRVAFQSDARNLGPAIDEFVVTNVFVWDGASGTVIAGASTQSGAPLDRVANGPSISGSGNRLAFHSTASNIFLTPTTHGNTYLNFLGLGTQLLATRWDSGVDPNNGSGSPSISGDGTWAAVFSTSTDLLGEPPLSTSPPGIYHVDLGGHGGGAKNALINHIPGSPTTADDSSSNPRNVALSASGGRVVFASQATDLVPGVNANASSNIYVWELATGDVKLVSRASGATGAPGNANSINSAISADGRYVSFESVSTNLDPAVTQPYQEVYVRDLETQTTTLVSRLDGADGAPADYNSLGASLSTSISGDGRYVAFASGAPNLTSEDCTTANWTDIFLRDRVANTTKLISRATRPDVGTCGNATGVRGDSEAAQLSADGTKLAFVSWSTNLGPAGNAFGTRQVYLADTGVAPAPVPPVVTPPVTTPPVTPAAVDTTAPKLSKLKIDPAVFAVLKAKGASLASAKKRPHRGATITFTTTEPGAVRFDVLTKPASAKSAAKKVVKRKPRKLGSLKRAAAVRGRNRVAFAGIVAGKALKPGMYTLRATVTDAAGNISRVVTATFRIVAAR